MKVIKVLPDDRIIVQFQDKYKYEKDIHYNNFKRGTIANPYDKTNCGVACVGIGKYKSVKENGRHTREYSTWNDMIVRCYKEKDRHLHPAYKDCIVCEEWLNFQIFTEWYHENYYEIDNGRMHLDKDILIENNKVYSPKTCIFVPQRINMLFASKPNKYNLPSGISLTYNKKYHTNYNGVYIGTYETLTEAMIYYNEEKIICIREIAEEYKSKIPKKLYDALYMFNGNIITQ